MVSHWLWVSKGEEESVKTSSTKITAKVYAIQIYSNKSGPVLTFPDISFVVASWVEKYETHWKLHSYWTFLALERSYTYDSYNSKYSMVCYVKYTCFEPIETFNFGFKA